MQHAATASQFCPIDTRVRVETNSVESLEYLISKLNPCHLAHRQYYDLKAQARWGKVARVLILLGLGYNLAVLVALFFLR